MLKVKHRGNFKNIDRFLNRIQNREYLNNLEDYGKLGVEALRASTPKDSGKTADSWVYAIEEGDESTSIVWTNTNENDGVNVALILQHGHGTGTGGYVEGIDYINPAMRPIFQHIADNAWKGVVKL